MAGMRLCYLYIFYLIFRYGKSQFSLFVKIFPRECNSLSVVGPSLIVIHWRAAFWAFTCKG
jgi:hypothetical protein